MKKGSRSIHCTVSLLCFCFWVSYTPLYNQSESFSFLFPPSGGRRIWGLVVLEKAFTANESLSVNLCVLCASVVQLRQLI